MPRSTIRDPDRRSFAALTREHFGEVLTVDEVFELVGADGASHQQPLSSAEAPLWVGSIGYERYRQNSDFARQLLRWRVERLIDVRELPISRRRGYAKTALRLALANEGIEYIHVRALGNPKPIRDLYKSGSPREGRRLYEAHVLTEQRTALSGLEALLREKRSALMCVEHDPGICHRTAIIDLLRDALGLSLEPVHIG